ncbi:MAG: RluA family pseudouridine synthase [Firmicutes bacterium]|nr:RluA family pseudouridine synthase [Bacillota bacterium]
MVRIVISDNTENQRLDRFLRKYFPKASLSHIYMMIRKDLKLNGKRAHEDTLLHSGDEVVIYMSDEEAASLMRKPKTVKAKRQFGIAYEDDHILVANKPFGLLTHGDSQEKKNHLANQVIAYLIEKGQYDPHVERSFAPSPANRIDRNTTGLVIFAKDAETLRELNAVLRHKEGIEKYYLTVCEGRFPQGETRLTGYMRKDEAKNRVTVSRSADDGKLMETAVTPIAYSLPGQGERSLLLVQIFTGRTHQIRAQLADAGHPLLGDSKYGARQTKVKSTQLLHSWKLRFTDMGDGQLAYLTGKTVTGEPPQDMMKIIGNLFGIRSTEELEDIVSDYL